MKRFWVIIMAAVMLLPSLIANHTEAAAAKGKILVVASSCARHGRTLMGESP